MPSARSPEPVIVLPVSSVEGERFRVAVYTAHGWLVSRYVVVLEKNDGFGWKEMKAVGTRSAVVRVTRARCSAALLALELQRTLNDCHERLNTPLGERSSG